MKPYQASCKLSVRDSIEEEFSDDVEDDVFIRDGKSAKVCVCFCFCVGEEFSYHTFSKY